MPSDNATDNATDSTSDLDARRRRALYRAAHRGTKEMDFLLGRYAAAKLAAMADADLERFEVLLSLPDPDLQGWIMGPGSASASATTITNEVSDLVAAVRHFHGLGS